MLLKFETFLGIEATGKNSVPSAEKVAAMRIIRVASDMEMFF